MTPLVEQRVFSVKDISFYNEKTHLHTFTGQDKEGRSTQERYLVMGQLVAESLVRSLALEVEKSGFSPDVIIGVTRGGFDPGRKMADYLNDLQIVVITLASGYNPDHTRVPPVFIQKLPSLLQTEKKLKKLRKLNSHQGIKRVLVVEEIIDQGDSVKKINQHIERKWHLSRTQRQIRYATLVARDAGLKTGLVDYYKLKTENWVIFPWERRESFKKLFKIWKAYKNPLPDSCIKERFTELGYSKKDIDWFGKDLFRPSRSPIKSG
ncbi:MAG: phosphoribosyltransferase family protein [Candidatus Gottesmanbacteria bacterium]